MPKPAVRPIRRSVCTTKSSTAPPAPALKQTVRENKAEALQKSQEETAAANIKAANIRISSQDVAPSQKEKANALPRSKVALTNKHRRGPNEGCEDSEEGSDDDDDQGVENEGSISRVKPGLARRGHINDLADNIRKRGIERIDSPTAQPKKKSKKNKVASNVAPVYQDAEETTDDDAANFEFRGIISDSEEEYDKENRKPPQYPGNDLTTEAKSIVTVDLTEGDEDETKRKRPKHSSFDNDTRATYNSEVLPRVYDQLARIGAWEHLSDAAIADIWNGLFDERLHVDPKAKDIPGLQWFMHVRKLIRRDYGNNWTRRFVARARSVVESVLKDRVGDSTEKAIALVRKWLGGNTTSEMKNREREQYPFFYSSSFDQDWDGIRLEGLYTNPMILHILAVHFEVAKDANGYEFCDRPVAALILAIQALHHVLLFTVDKGEYKFPKSNNRRAQFSARNWADKRIANPKPGGSTLTRFVERHRANIAEFSDDKWEVIIKEAKELAVEYLARKRGNKKNAKKQEESAPEIRYDWGSDDDGEPLLDSSFG